MTILGVDSSSEPMSVALAEDGRIISEYYLSLGLTHSETLMCVLNEMLRQTGTDLRDIDAVAVTSGPGSFTGLRIGSGTVKGIADALDIPIIGVPTLEVMAFNIYDKDSLIVPMLDARRRNVYAGAYAYEGEELKEKLPQCITGITELLLKIPDWGKRTVFTGDAEERFRDEIEKELKVPFSFAPPHIRNQRAGALCVLALKRYNAGEIMKAGDFKPDYIKATHAEEERREAEKQGKLKELSEGLSILPEKGF